MNGLLTGRHGLAVSLTTTIARESSTDLLLARSGGVEIRSVALPSLAPALRRLVGVI